MNGAEQERPCEEMLCMIGRSFDRDLEKQELLAFYHHILRCDLCRTRMSELVDQERNFAAAGRSYEHFALPADFNQRVLKTVAQLRPSRQKERAVGPGSWLGNVQGVFRHALKPVAAALAVVVVGAVALSWLWTTGHFRATPARLLVHDVSLQMAKGSVNWNHEQTVPPNYDMFMRVNERDPQPYFFRLSASEPIKIFLIHSGASDKTLKRQELLLSGDRYATLKMPQVNDVVLIRNQGGRPLQVNAYAPHPEAITYGIKRSVNSTK